MAHLIEFGRHKRNQSLPTEPHPDENLLAAFAEGALKEALRTPLLRHLNVCPACRGVVSLSLVDALPAAPQVSAVRWFRPRWPAWRWAGAFGAAAVLLATAWIGHGEFNQAPAPAPRLYAAAGTTGVPGLPVRSEDRRPAHGVAATSASAAGPHSSRSVSAGERLPAPAMTPGFTGRLDRSAIETGFVTGPAALPSSGMPVLAAGNAAGFAEPAGRRSSTQWMVANSGLLYQSFNNGTSWQSVMIRADVVFRAVSFSGDEVWAGGSGGALFHSSDGGRRWTKVVPVCNGLVLVDDIVRVSFSDGGQGRLVTASGRTWATPDQGATWEMQ